VAQLGDACKGLQRGGLKVEANEVEEQWKSAKDPWEKV